MPAEREGEPLRVDLQDDCPPLQVLLAGIGNVHVGGLAVTNGSLHLQPETPPEFAGVGQCAPNLHDGGMSIVSS